MQCLSIGGMNVTNRSLKILRVIDGGLQKELKCGRESEETL